ncbi:6-deoxy-6-sulfogluconolactonase [Rhodovastum atsumiense]|uniref:SMP-30/gluconolactonase/LRE family protein n=1 Tax=Rhodovastum atsumiense TaxID=504468 RepID=A0A5M6J1B2_9PROT|nr:SMP-30/gluconolactonase/LRE family protein [Rhodovastum atsumiense]KAA5614304.1 SMP-30/gluconolactonase/LRE family protein [Rhodovastum atsumiense]CAH2604764.1 6-deoxy-6-sulfogluconolactonase [Rhodovastum atsumiense]
MDTPRRIGTTTDILGEGPVWCPRAQALWWVDIKGPAVRRWDAARDTTQSWSLPEAVGALALRGDGDGLLLALARGLAFFDPATGALSPAAEPHGGDADLRFNDGKCDRQGRFWAGTMGETRRTPRGRLFRLQPQTGAQPVLEGLTIPNGPCWSPDGRIFYLADSPTRTIQAFPYDPATGEIGPAACFARIEPPGVPDGATVDAGGYLWSAEHGGGRITRYAPDGRVDRRLELPVSQPTSCAFGGPDLATLFITSAREGLDAAALAAQPLAGAVLAVATGVRGLAEPRYAG